MFSGHLEQGSENTGQGQVPVREEIVTGPCETKAKLVQKWLELPT